MYVSVFLSVVDVDKTLGQMDKVIGYHHLADDVETKVQDGPCGDVEAYIKVYFIQSIKLASLPHAVCVRCWID